MIDNMQLSELRERAKEKGLKNISKLKKAELIELLKTVEKKSNTDETAKIEFKSKKKTEDREEAQVILEEDDKDEEKEEFISRKWCIQGYR